MAIQHSICEIRGQGAIPSFNLAALRATPQRRKRQPIGFIQHQTNHHA